MFQSNYHCFWTSAKKHYLKVVKIVFPFRYQRRSVFKLASCLKTSSTEITAMSAINDFLSCILFLSLIIAAAVNETVKTSLELTKQVHSSLLRIGFDNFCLNHNYIIKSSYGAYRLPLQTSLLKHLGVCIFFFQECLHSNLLLGFTVYLLPNKSWEQSYILSRIECSQSWFPVKVQVKSAKMRKKYLFSYFLSD